MAAKRLKRPEKISVTLTGALEKAGLGRIAVMGGLARSWRKVAGEGMAKHSAPVMLKGGTLTLVVDSPAWMNEISLLTPDIIEKINAELGEGTVADIRLRQGAVGAGVQDGATGGVANKKVSKPARRELTPAEMDIIEENVSEIEDPGVREAVRRLLIAACATVRE